MTGPGGHDTRTALMERLGMTQQTETHDAEVSRFYADTGGGAARVYEQMMGHDRAHMWFHGDRTVLEHGGTPLEAAVTMLQRLAGHAGLKSGMRVLEFGSGAGGAARKLAELFDVTVVGVSSTESLNQRARSLTDDCYRGRVSFLTVGGSDYESLPAWADHSFDAVVTMEAMCHLPHKRRFVTAAHRVLRPGGRLVVLDWFQRRFGEHQTPEQIAALIDPVCRGYSLAAPLGTLESYAHAMRDAGFVNIQAHDEYADQPCWGSTEPLELWSDLDDPQRRHHLDAKRALDAARQAGVFTVGTVVATKPRS